MQLYVADYMADTRHLTTEQHGAYLLLLMTMWKAGGSLPNDPSKLARIAGVSARRWHIVSPEVMEFFDADGDVLTQKRLVREYEKAVSKSEKRSAAGSLGGKAKALKSNDQGLANATASPKHSSEPESERKEEPNGSSKRASRLPANWTLPKPWGEWAMGEGMDEVSVRRQADRFRDYWLAAPGQKGVKRDWLATWRNWVRKAMEDTRTQASNTKPKPGETRIRNGQKQIWTGFDGWVREYA